MAATWRRSPPRAVLFDLFNTLIPGGRRDERDAVAHRMAHSLDVDPDDLACLIRATFDDRCRGLLGGIHDTVAWLAAELGARPTADAIAAAVEMRLEMTRSLHRRTWAVDALSSLGESGLLRGLITDCSAETPTIWGDSPLAPHVEAVSFSCVTGHRKPDPEAYLTATRALGVEPSACLFVGDGGSHELSGALSLGMHAVRFHPPSGRSDDPVDDEIDWPGDTVADLMQLVSALVDYP